MEGFLGLKTDVNGMVERRVFVAKSDRIIIITTMTMMIFPGSFQVLKIQFFCNVKLWPWEQGY